MMSSHRARYHWRREKRCPPPPTLDGDLAVAVEGIAQLRRTRESPSLRKWVLHFRASPVASRCSPEPASGEKQVLFLA
ncbi:hypothetical protein E2320_014770 [Naja naja]|nr:hypothetical protein E2320_014770 [Naja naja]